MRRLHSLITDFIVFMPLKVKELRSRAEDAARTVQSYAQVTTMTCFVLFKDLQYCNDCFIITIVTLIILARIGSSSKFASSL